jgi:hypothetical protein
LSATSPELAALFSEIWSLQQRPELTQPFRSLCLCPKNSVSRQRRARYRCAVVSKNSAGACVARKRAVPAEQQSVAACQSQPRPTGAPLGLHLPLPSTSGAAAILFVPPNKVGQAGPVESLEASFHRSWSQCRPGSHRPRDALEVLRPKVLKLEQLPTSFRVLSAITRSSQTDGGNFIRCVFTTA